ncbi:MAG: hypothetical protein AMXMBFR80_00950 [Dehalococcoidia bacterium]|jgi:hypothetical protein|nr:hypothetical protein [Tepidiformaceae bacterium]
MAKAPWNEVEALVKHLFEAGLQPDRQDLVDLAFNGNASDDVIDALDSLNGKPVPSLDSLKQQLEANGMIE